ncbi:hypothetical protein RJ639_042887 [Escallonia herrerae]|uniref:Uncharacterized protein n=1 Tax=Escallonia herrerae TaxID=1293975 RepID=A0AA88WA74_9ASTE|nr:hypothetical protein RJ639_042887 [Escallonia herrerae]
MPERVWLKRKPAPSAAFLCGFSVQYVLDPNLPPLLEVTDNDSDETKTARKKHSGHRNITDEQHAFIRHVTADLLLLTADVTEIPSPAFKIASFFHKTGLIWHDLGEFELVSTCFEKATDLTSKIEISAIFGDEERKLLLDLSIARSRTAWEVQDRNLAVNLLNRSKFVLFGCAANYKQLANQYMIFGKTVLSKNETSSVNEALKLMNEALDLCEKGLRIVKRESETLGLK